MNNYCITFNIFKTYDKTKINYGIVPCDIVKFSSLEEITKKYSFKSKVSNEVMKNFKKKKDYYFFYTRKNKQICFRVVFTSKNNMEIAEKELIKKAKKILFKKIPFNFKLKNKINNRIERILM